MLRTVPALALATLLAFAGLVAANDADDDKAGHEESDASGSNGTAAPHNGSAPAPAPDCSRAKDREACKAASCREHPEDPRCPVRPNGNGSDSGKRPEHPEARHDRLEHIEFTLESPTEATRFKVDGHPTLDRISFLTGGGASATERKGDLLVMGDGDSRLRFHDTPVGHIEFKGEDGSVRLSFPAGATVRAGEQGHAARIHYPDGRDGLLVADEAAWDGRNVTLTGFFSFHVTRGSGPFEEGGREGGEEASELRSKMRTALEKRHLGAEVALEHRPANASKAVQVMAYDDLAVNVTLPDAAAPGAPIAVRIGAELEEGRTVVIHVDPALVGNATADRLELRYYNEHDDGTQTEVVFLRAASLADVLDPTDDAGQPEYWVVEDADGLQVLVSVPHWSVHTVTIAGLGALLQPSVLVGVLAGAAGTALAAVAMFWPRRRE